MTFVTMEQGNKERGTKNGNTGWGLREIKKQARNNRTCLLVGVTGFEPAATRPPDVYSTGLSYTPIYREDFRGSVGRGDRI